MFRKLDACSGENLGQLSVAAAIRLQALAPAPDGRKLFDHFG